MKRAATNQNSERREREDGVWWRAWCFGGACFLFFLSSFFSLWFLVPFRSFADGRKGGRRKRSGKGSSSRSARPILTDLFACGSRCLLHLTSVSLSFPCNQNFHYKPPHLAAATHCAHPYHHLHLSQPHITLTQGVRSSNHPSKDRKKTLLSLLKDENL